MIINIPKTNEINCVSRPNPHLGIHIRPLPGIDLIEEVKLLSVMFSNRLHFELHVQVTFKMCSQRS
jgi:hypothetical protein